MSVDILGTSCDQCQSMVQYIFTSTETRRLVRTDSPGRPPRLSHQLLNYEANLISGIISGPIFVMWLMIAYIALFSALLSRPTALACGSTWVTGFLKRVFLTIHRSGELTALASTEVVYLQRWHPPKWCTYSAGIHRSGVLTALASTEVVYLQRWHGRWKFCVHRTTMCNATSCKATYVRCIVFTCNLPPALLAEWPGYVACYCGNTGAEWIPK